MFPSSSSIGTYVVCCVQEASLMWTYVCAPYGNMYLLSGCAEHTLGNLVDIVISSNCNSSSWNWNHQVMFNVAFNIVSIWLVYHTDIFPIFNRLILERRFIRKYGIAQQAGHTASFSVKSTRSSINLCRIRVSIRPYSRLYECKYLMRRMYGYLDRIYNIYTYVDGLVPYVERTRALL